MSTWWLSWADGAGGGRMECDGEEHAMAEKAAMRRGGKRDCVAWFDAESVGPWVAEEACR